MVTDFHLNNYRPLGMHDLTFVHNDLKSSNITVKQDTEELFVIDFESVNRRGRVASISTNGYKVPERFIEPYLSYFQSDVYSMGIIFAKQLSMSNY